MHTLYKARRCILFFGDGSDFVLCVHATTPSACLMEPLEHPSSSLSSSKMSIQHVHKQPRWRVYMSIPSNGCSDLGPCHFGESEFLEFLAKRSAVGSFSPREATNLRWLAMWYQHGIIFRHICQRSCWFILPVISALWYLYYGSFMPSSLDLRFTIINIIVWVKRRVGSFGTDGLTLFICNYFIDRCRSLRQH